MRLFLMRHGEMPWNRRQRCQGVSDAPLSATGRAQAAVLAAALLAFGHRLARRARWATAALALVVLAGLLLGGCGRTGLFAGLSPKPRTAVQASDALAETAITRIAVLPFASVAGPPGEAEFLSAQVRETLQARPRLSVATAGEVAEAVATVGGAAPVGRLDLTPALLRAIARELGADGTVTGRLTRFRERQGTALAARAPASIQFSVELWRGTDGALLWRGEYNETQEALSENLADAGTFFRGGGRWLTARELARLGVEELLKRLPAPILPGAPPGPAPSPT
jgi:hypothetical protein